MEHGEHTKQPEKAIQTFTTEELKGVYGEFLQDLNQKERDVLSTGSLKEGEPFIASLDKFFQDHSKGTADDCMKFNHFLREFYETQIAAGESGEEIDPQQKLFFQIVQDKLMSRLEDFGFDARAAVDDDEAMAETERAPNAEPEEEAPQESQVRPVKKPQEQAVAPEQTEAAVLPQPEKYVRLQEKIDLKAHIKSYIDSVDYELRELFYMKGTWEDPDRNFEPREESFAEGLEAWAKEKVDTKDGLRMNVFDEYVTKLKNRYENTPKAADSKEHEFKKAQHEVAEKMMGLFSGKEKSEKKKKQLLGEHWSWDNIKFTGLNMARQFWELLGGKGSADWFFDYSKLDQNGKRVEAVAQGVQKAAAAASGGGSVTSLTDFVDRKKAAAAAKEAGEAINRRAA